ncbi:4Fe-4S dicluster domain-containing protein [Brevibacillus sp. SYSU BS000544]|uniref:4Fe-4S dicluster domain-containing protein n=1 Tax=Brevibacillus sp. SYSU BS000544 TaxID=3416443 RepID=UPI003CE59E8B
MINLFKLMNAFERHASPVEIQKEVCTRLKSTASTCTLCMDNCPSNSIRLTAKEIVMTDCLECGICGVVCPTNAFSWKRPSFKRMLEQTERQFVDEGRVYITCSKQLFPEQIVGLKVPCLAVIPWEVWMSMLLTSPSLSIYLPEGSCQTCEVTTGERVWSEQLGRAETLCEKKATRYFSVEKIDRDYAYDSSRRQFLQFALHEFKESGKEVFKEILGETQEQRLAEISEIPEEIRQKKAEIVEKILRESRYTYVERRKILLHQLQQDQNLMQRMTVKLPVINDSCDICGACTILCPTQALRMIETENGLGREIRLQPATCVECGLCREVCWEKNISLVEHPAEVLFQSESSLI